MSADSLRDPPTSGGAGPPRHPIFGGRLSGPKVPCQGFCKFENHPKKNMFRVKPPAVSVFVPRRNGELSWFFLFKQRQLMTNGNNSGAEKL